MNFTTRAEFGSVLLALALSGAGLTICSAAGAQTPPPGTPPPEESLPTQRSTSPVVVPPVNSAPAPAPLPRWVDGFARADTDRNGSVSREELEAQAAEGRSFGAIDRDGDGVVSQQEWLAYDASQPVPEDGDEE
jgi:hypothetical protein